MVFLEPEQYQQRCAQLFNSYQKDISTLLPFAKIEHIGSSAIPNAISKVIWIFTLKLSLSSLKLQLKG